MDLAGNVDGTPATYTWSIDDRPNLAPYQPSGWSDKIVVSTSTNATTDSASMSSSDVLYVNWAVINQGTVPTNTRFSTSLYIDGTLWVSWYWASPLDVSHFVWVRDFLIGTLNEGTHTIRIRTDSTDKISEIDEGNNNYTKTITVSRGVGVGKPDLMPYQPPDWSSPIVVSKTKGATADSASFKRSDVLYVNWSTRNGGTSATSKRYFTALYVDGVHRISWYTDPPLIPRFYLSVTDYSIGKLAAGTHTIRIKSDSTGIIDESDEGNNSYTKTIIVE
jgi:subtilase family serine protease